MRKKIVNSLITATVIGSMLTGMAVPCFAGEKKDDGSSITVLVESGSPAEALANDTAADFEKETGCKVVIAQYNTNFRSNTFDISTEAISRNSINGSVTLKLKRFATVTKCSSSIPI